MCQRTQRRQRRCGNARAGGAAPASGFAEHLGLHYFDVNPRGLLRTSEVTVQDSFPEPSNKPKSAAISTPSEHGRCYRDGYPAYGGGGEGAGGGVGLKG